MTSIAISAVPMGAEAALASFQLELERALADLLVLPDEAALDARLADPERSAAVHRDHDRPSAGSLHACARVAAVARRA